MNNDDIFKSATYAARHAYLADAIRATGKIIGTRPDMIIMDDIKPDEDSESVPLTRITDPAKIREKIQQDAEDTLSMALATVMAAGFSAVSVDADMNASHVSADLYEPSEAQQQMLAALKSEVSPQQPGGIVWNWDNIKHRRGAFYVTREVMEESPDAVAVIMAQCIILEAGFRWDINGIQYYALSPMFQKVPEGGQMPCYTWDFGRDEYGFVKNVRVDELTTNASGLTCYVCGHAITEGDDGKLHGSNEDCGVCKGPLKKPNSKQNQKVKS